MSDVFFDNIFTDMAFHSGSTPFFRDWPGGKSHAVIFRENSRFSSRSGSRSHPRRFAFTPGNAIITDKPSYTKLKAQKDAATHRADTAGSQLIEASQSLEESRKALYAFRQDTFQRVVAEQRDTNPSERPPSYHRPESIPTEQTVAPNITEPPTPQDVYTSSTPPKWGTSK